MNDNLLELNNLVFSFDDRLIFNNFNLKIMKGHIVSIVGSNNSGKSTLAKIIGGIYLTDDMINLGKMRLNYKNISAYKKNVSYINFSSFEFREKTVYDEILCAIDFVKWQDDKKENMINKILERFELLSYQNRHPSRLSKINKINLFLAKALVFNPKLVVMELDDLYLNEVNKKQIFDVLNKYVNSGMSVVYSTNNSEDILYSDSIVVLHNGSVAVSGSTMAVLKKDSLLLKLGIELPFMVDLSSKLEFYNVIDKIYLDAEELVNELWK